ncbi:MAG: DUF2855 family protein [Saprospiraceae bacterium]
MQNTTFQVQRSQLSQTQLVTTDLPALEAGQVLLKVDQFALTANNITYGVVGDQIGYWHFFPATDGWGVLPVWGFADVVASENAGVKVGERFYGYYPMADYLVVEAGKVSPFGFLDITAHRKPLPVLYNRYTNVAMEKAYASSSAAIQMIFRPLFTTSFLLDDMLIDNDLFGAEQVILTSASSKTAFSLAFLLNQRTDRNYKIVGLTSARNIDFVNGLGCYDSVLAYEDLQAIADTTTVIVDFAGNKPLLLNLQDQLQNRLKFISQVGVVHHDQRVGDGKVKGKFFFAPAYAEQRLKDWTPVGFQQRIGAAWLEFVNAGSDWLKISETKGLSQMDAIYQKVLDGSADAKIGQIIEP